MNLFFSIIILLLIIYSFIIKKYKLIFYLSILSLIGNLFSVHLFGMRMKIISIVSILFFIFYLSGKIKKYENYYQFKFIFKYELYLLILSGILFSIFFPWESQFEDILPFTQKLHIKAIIGVFRIFSDFLIVVSIPILFSKYKINLSKFLFWCLAVQLIISVIDFSTGNFLRSLIFDAPELIEKRFFGFNHEPRSFGRNSLYALLVLVYLYKLSGKKDSYAFRGIILAILSIIISFSLSTYIALLLIIISSSFKNIKVLFTKVFFTLFIGAIIINIKFVKTNTQEKFISTFIEGSMLREKFEGPSWFSHFELYNSAYLYFIWDNPIFLFTGTGPNLINIAYEKYAIIDWKLNSSEHNDYFVSTAPTIGLFRLLARSGLIGLFVYFLLYKRMRKKIKSNNNTLVRNSQLLLLRQVFILIAIIYTQFFYFLIGFLIFQMLKGKPNFKNQLDK